MEWLEEEGVRWGEFPEITRLGVRHGFSTRQGGVSSGGCDSLNIGLMADKENPDRTLENRRRLFKVLGFSLDHLVSYRQVHSATVKIVETPGIFSEEADGTITAKNNVVLMALAADCAPVLIVDPVRHTLGVVHSGWRGTAQEIVPRAVEQMTRSFGTKAKDIWVGIGPSIGRCCYEVSRDVFDQTWGSVRKPEVAMGTNPHLDIPKVITAQLVERGVLLNQVLTSEHCTHCESEHFFSHRKGAAGRCALLASW